MMSKQRGLSLIGLLLGLAAIGCVFLIGAKSAPAWIEYWNVRKVISTMASQGDLAAGAAPVEVRKSFDRRAIIDDITAVTGKDLEIAKDASGITVSYAYQKVVPIAGNTSLLFDFSGSTGSAGSGRRAIQ